jgi:predicted metal-dependent hydrolase
MKLVRYIFYVSTIFQVAVSLLRDPATYRPWVLLSSIRRARRQPFFSRETWRQLKEYERRGFHPSDRPNQELVAEWRETLFGAMGSMTSTLRGAALAS